MPDYDLIEYLTGEKPKRLEPIDEHGKQILANLNNPNLVDDGEQFKDIAPVDPKEYTIVKK